MNKSAVLLVNLGSPASPAVPDVRRYLREFLMDPRVLDAPYPIRFFVVHGLILPFRPRQSAEAYHSIWTPEGSPLVVSGQRVRQDLEGRLGLAVAVAMRYQNPSIEQAVRQLHQAGVTHVALIPMFPHYAMSSFETAVVRVREVAARLAPGMRLSVQAPYYERPDYVDALVASAQPGLSRGYDHLLFSFHGIPERHLRKSDPTRRHCLGTPNCCEQPSPAHATCYRHQCFQTVKAFVRQAGVPEGKYSVAFQSRLGRDPWLTPYADQRIVQLAAEGVGRLAVMCPAFVADCLETIEEIGLRGRESFLKAGGREFTLLPCLNEHPRWVDALEGMARELLEPTAPRRQAATATPTTP